MNHFFLLIASFFLLSSLQAASFQPIKDGPIHEAYVVQEYGTLLLETVPTEPPPPITEVTPAHDDPESIWIPGYWGWSAKHGLFLWISGTWRRPPPEHQWISGYWKQIPEGWIWIRGFWSPKELKELNFSANPPPDPIDEDIPAPPENAQDYFWILGYWSYDKEENQYTWLSGRWELIDPHWLYVPPRYQWREQGYLFLPDFWDWPIDNRGLAFSAVAVDFSSLNLVAYEPVKGLQQLVVMENLFPQWPNFANMFHYHYLFHQDSWKVWDATPPWWEWPTWWCFTWTDSWWLWWWWSHPGYTTPPWLSEDLTQQISPPTSSVIHLMEKVKPPVNVTANGVVGSKKILTALHKIEGRPIPILPSDPKQIIQIQEFAGPQRSASRNMLPTGKGMAEAPLKKPFFGPSLQSFKVPPKELVPPKRPSLVNRRPPENLSTQNFDRGESFLTYFLPILANYPYSRSYSETESYNSPQQQQSIYRQYPQTHPHPRYRTPQTPRTELPTYTPQPNVQERSLYTFPAERPIHQPTRPPFYGPNPEIESGPPSNIQHGVKVPGDLESHNHYHMRYAPYPGVRYEAPIQGYTRPGSNHQLTPMQTEHHDFYMSHPMYQVNPQGPRVHQMPGDYSTLPEQ